MEQLKALRLSSLIIIQIELRAFCSKHSDLQENRNILPLGGSIAVGSEIPEANVLPVTLPVKSEHNLKIGCSNGGLESDSNRDKLNHNDGGLQFLVHFLVNHVSFLMAITLFS